jgi:hypothetical protein
MMDASPTNESIPSELRKLGSNVLGMLQTLWKRPERQKADKLIRHQFYTVLKMTNRELEKAIQSLSSSPGVQDGAESVSQTSAANPASQAGLPGSSSSAVKKEG